MKETEQRIFKTMDRLILEKQIKNKTEFCTTIGMYPQNLTQVKRGRNRFTVSQISSICKEYNVNGNWILGTQENMFIKE
jgi:DNA-binding Xre family transcriptional regulator